MEILKWILCGLIIIAMYCLVEIYAKKHNKDLFNYRIFCRNNRIFSIRYINKIKLRSKQMTINHIYNIVVNTMNKLENIDFISLDKRKYNQQQLNEAYRILDNLKDELIRENIKNKQKGAQKI